MVTPEDLCRGLGLREPVHLVGVGGAGMSALAELLLDAGIQVTGCEARPSRRTVSLQNRGLVVWTGHGDHGPAGSAVYTAAAGRRHPEVVCLRARGVPVFPRALILARLSRLVPTVCVAGTHGKSTVTALLTHVLRAGSTDPACLVGGVYQGAGFGGRWGRGELLVAETDEFDRSLELVRPWCAVVTNVEPEHLEVFGTPRRLAAAFRRFCLRAAHPVVWVPGLPFAQGADWVRCGHEAPVSCRVVEPGPPLRLLVAWEDGTTLPVEFPLPGRHHAANVTLVAATARLLGVPPEAIAGAVRSYPGLERRMELLGRVGSVRVYSDYAHHPTEIRVTLRALAQGAKPLVAVFQPHLYSRTATFLDDFAASFRDASRVIVVPIYGAREDPIPGVTSQVLAQRIRQRGVEARAVEDFCALGQVLDSELETAHTIVFLTAGDLDEFARAWCASRASRGR